jgi:hypothetical protein
MTGVEEKRVPCASALGQIHDDFLSHKLTFSNLGIRKTDVGDVWLHPYAQELIFVPNICVGCSLGAGKFRRRDLKAAIDDRS